VNLVKYFCKSVNLNRSYDGLKMYDKLAAMMDWCIDDLFGKEGNDEKKIMKCFGSPGYLLTLLSVGLSIIEFGVQANLPMFVLALALLPRTCDNFQRQNTFVLMILSFSPLSIKCNFFSLSYRSFLFLRQ